MCVCIYVSVSVAELMVNEKAGVSFIYVVELMVCEKTCKYKSEGR